MTAHDPLARIEARVRQLLWLVGLNIVLLLGVIAVWCRLLGQVR